MRTITIGLLGCGTVGGGFVALLERERERIRARYAIDFQLTRILVRDDARERSVGSELLTTSPLAVIDDDCDMVVEVIGGVHTAGALVRRALALRKHVVTANKALLAACGAELFEAAARSDVELGFEASVCGAVPVIGALRRGLAGDSIESIRGILNGTSNYVLCRMEQGLSLADAVSCAQELGFAEADPSLDLSGEDAAQKLAILAQLAYGEPVRRSSVRGITHVSERDVAKARQKGSVIRLVAEARRVTGGVELEVSPRELTADDPLAGTRNEQNAVAIRGRALGEIFFSGPGAGSLPTAAAVLSDVIAIGVASRRQVMVA